MLQQSNNNYFCNNVIIIILRIFMFLCSSATLTLLIIYWNDEVEHDVYIDNDNIKIHVYWPILVFNIILFIVTTMITIGFIKSSLMRSQNNMFTFFCFCPYVFGLFSLISHGFYAMYYVCKYGTRCFEIKTPLYIPIIIFMAIIFVIIVCLLVALILKCLNIKLCSYEIDLPYNEANKTNNILLFYIPIDYHSLS